MRHKETSSLKLIYQCGHVAGLCRISTKRKLRTSRAYCCRQTRNVCDRQACTISITTSYIGVYTHRVTCDFALQSKSPTIAFPRVSDADTDSGPETSVDAHFDFYGPPRHVCRRESGGHGRVRGSAPDPAPDLPICGLVLSTLTSRRAVTACLTSDCTES